MGILTNDINELGRILVGEYYDIEVTGMNKIAYNRALIDGHPGESLESLHQLIGTCEVFENVLWKYNKDYETLIKEIYDLKMPFDEDSKWTRQYIAEKIRQLLGQKLDTNRCFGWGRQILDNWITVGATYTFPRGCNSFQIVRVKLIEK